ncbi:hypothetical protein BJX96DRAFT_149858, partial [Aspergillus floccosus]
MVSILIRSQQRPCGGPQPAPGLPTCAPTRACPSNVGMRPTPWGPADSSARRRRNHAVSRGDDTTAAGRTI